MKENRHNCQSIMKARSPLTQFITDGLYWNRINSLRRPTVKYRRCSIHTAKQTSLMGCFQLFFSIRRRSL